MPNTFYTHTFNYCNGTICESVVKLQSFWHSKIETTIISIEWAKINKWFNCPKGNDCFAFHLYLFLLHSLFGDWFVNPKFKVNSFGTLSINTKLYYTIAFRFLQSNSSGFLCSLCLLNAISFVWASSIQFNACSAQKKSN